ncbi:hypothetical protein ACIBL8_29135 [Streptomyces sp. NPDC050523]|uniref:hypothetical protein n=1 Tax=Streptomyces sp. NPDC050523 TaxID=3365622 RepID=UPI0037B8CAC3
MSDKKVPGFQIEGLWKETSDPGEGEDANSEGADSEGADSEGADPEGEGPDGERGDSDAPDSVPVVDSTGRVVAVASRGPDGRLEFTDPDDVVVIALPVDDSPKDDSPRIDVESLGGRRPSDVAAASPQAGTPGLADPRSFDFKPHRWANWQETSCVPVIFGYGSPFLPRMNFKIKIQVGVPIKLRDGRRITVREAQLDSSTGATIAGTAIIRKLDSGTIEPSAVQSEFLVIMQGWMNAYGIGYRVNAC